MTRFFARFFALVQPSTHGDLKAGMVGVGQARCARDVTHPFVVTKGRKRLRLRVCEAEGLRDWLTEQLKRDDVRRPV